MTEPAAGVQVLAPGTSDDARSAAQGGLALLVLQAAVRVIGLAFVLVVTRALAPGDFGRYSIAAAIVLFGGIVADLGTTTAITRTVSADPSSADGLLSATILPAVGLGIVAWVGCVAFAAAAHYPEVTLIDVAIAGAALPLTSGLTSVLGALDGLGAIVQRSALTVSQTTLSLLAGGAVVAAALGPRALIASTLTGPVVTAGAAIVVARRRGIWSTAPRVDLTTTWWLVRRAGPYAVLAGIAMIFRRFDVVVLSLVRGRVEVADYDLALRVTDALGFIGSAISAPALFLFSRRLQVGDIAGAQRGLSLAARAVYLVGFPVAAILASASEPLVGAVFGSAYSGAAIPLAVLGGAVWLDFVGVVQGAALAAGARLRQAIVLSIWLVIAYSTLDVLLILRWGATGAAAAMAGFEMVSVVAIAMFNHRVNGVRLPTPGGRVIVAAVVCGGATRLTLPVLGLAAVGVGMLTYAAAIVLSRAVSVDDIWLVRRLVLRQRPAG